MYHTFIELLVCYILCLVRTKVLSDFPFQCIDQNEYVEIILCFPIEAGWLIVVKMWENWSYSWNFKGLILYFQAWMLRYIAMIKIISIFFYHYNILWYVLWLKLVLTFNSQEITRCEVHNNKRLCDNGSGMQRADRGLSHPSCTQLHPQFVYLSCLQTQLGIVLYYVRARIGIHGGWTWLVGWWISSRPRPSSPMSSMIEGSLCLACPLWDSFDPQSIYPYNCQTCHRWRTQSMFC